MTDILTILAEAGLDIAEDKKKGLIKAVSENYKTVTEFQKKVDRLTELETQNNELSDKIKTFDGDKSKLEELQNKVNDYEKADKERKEQQEAAELENTLRERFKPLNGENKYINEYTEKAMFEEFKTALGDKSNEGKSDKDVFTAITKDKNIYQNPQQVIIPPVGGKVNDNIAEIDEARKIMGIKINK